MCLRQSENRMSLYPSVARLGIGYAPGCRTKGTEVIYDILWASRQSCEVGAKMEAGDDHEGSNRSWSFPLRQIWDCGRRSSGTDLASFLRNRRLRANCPAKPFASRRFYPLVTTKPARRSSWPWDRRLGARNTHSERIQTLLRTSSGLRVAGSGRWID
jgi:hypothetical protein